MIVMRFSIIGNRFIFFSTKLVSKHGNIGNKRTLFFFLFNLSLMLIMFFSDVLFFFLWFKLINNGLCCIFCFLFWNFVGKVLGEVKKFWFLVMYRFVACRWDYEREKKFILIMLLLDFVYNWREMKWVHVWNDCEYGRMMVCYCDFGRSYDLKLE